MRDPNRIKPLLARLEALWTQFPDLRLGQLIGNVWEDTYYVEDESLIAGIEREHQSSGLPTDAPRSSHRMGS